MRLPFDRGVGAVVPFRAGHLVSDTVYFEGTVGLHLVEDGRRVASWPRYGHCHGGYPHTSADGSLVAWMTLRCPESLDRTLPTVQLATREGTCVRSQRVAGDPFQLTHVAGFLGDQVVYVAGGVWISDAVAPPRRVPGISSASDTAPTSGLLLSGGRVVAPDGSVRWRYRGHLEAFSPRETRVLALVGRRRAVVLEVDDGSTVAQLELPAGASTSGLVWETDRTLLTTMERAGGTALVRVGVGGRVERVTPVRPTSPRRPAYTTLPIG